MKILKYIVQVIFTLLLWAVFVIIGTFNGFWKYPITNQTSSEAFIEAIKKELDNHFVGNMAVALIEDGKVSKEYFYSIDKPINRYTMFQMASISKWVTAWGVFALVEDGKLDLDTPINTYLTRWQLPESEFNNHEVTIRKLLSHTAGLTDGLGYAGFAPDETVQTLESSLTKAKDALGSADGIVKVGIKPGSKYKYSGGGYAILQLIIEEISGQTFQQYMKQTVFEPLQMNHSTFHWADTLNFDLATFYDRDTSIATHFRYTSLAAASLYTCLADFELFLKAHTTKKIVLKEETLRIMSKPTAHIWGKGVHGLGPIIYGKNGDGSYIIGHEGNNRPAINNSARLNSETRDGIIIFETGNSKLASILGSEWVYWKTGIVDLLMVYYSLNRILTLIGIGWGIIAILSYFFIRRNLKLKKVKLKAKG